MTESYRRSNDEPGSNVERSTVEASGGDNLGMAERLFLIEQALEQIQGAPGVGFLGLCVNQALHPDLEHPHWDAYHVKLAKRMSR